MPKKRKGSGRYDNETVDSRTSKAESAKLTINSYQDVADSEDEFLDNRDRILLDEGPAVKKRRKIQEQGAHIAVVSLLESMLTSGRCAAGSFRRRSARSARLR